MASHPRFKNILLLPSPWSEYAQTNIFVFIKPVHTTPKTLYVFFICYDKFIIVFPLFGLFLGSNSFLVISIISKFVQYNFGKLSADVTENIKSRKCREL